MHCNGSVHCRESVFNGKCKIAWASGRNYHCLSVGKVVTVRCSSLFDFCLTSSCLGRDNTYTSAICYHYHTKYWRRPKSRSIVKLGEEVLLALRYDYRVSRRGFEPGSVEHFTTRPKDSLKLLLTSRFYTLHHSYTHAKYLRVVIRKVIGCTCSSY